MQRLTAAVVTALIVLSELVGGPAHALVAETPSDRRPGQGIRDLSKALRQKPVIYVNGCHQWRPNVQPRACAHGKTRGYAGTVLLLGDSHAAHWFGPLRAAATAAGWRLLTVTKSSCPSDSLFVRRYRQTQPYLECNRWRERVFRKLRNGGYGRIDAAIIGSWEFHQVLDSHRKLLRGQARVRAWQAGTERTLRTLTAVIPSVYVLRDSPQLPGGTTGFQACIRAYQQRPRRCGTTATEALSTAIWGAKTRAVATYADRGVRALDWTSELCPHNFCNPVSGSRLVFQDDNHLAQPFARRHWTPRFITLLRSMPTGR